MAKEFSVGDCSWDDGAILSVFNRSIRKHRTQKRVALCNESSGNAAIPGSQSDALTPRVPPQAQTLSGPPRLFQAADRTVERCAENYSHPMGSPWKRSRSTMSEHLHTPIGNPVAPSAASSLSLSEHINAYQKVLLQPQISDVPLAPSTSGHVEERSSRAISFPESRKSASTGLAETDSSTKCAMGKRAIPNERNSSLVKVSEIQKTAIGVIPYEGSDASSAAAVVDHQDGIGKTKRNGGNVTFSEQTRNNNSPTTSRSFGGHAERNPIFLQPSLEMEKSANQVDSSFLSAHKIRPAMDTAGNESAAAIGVSNSGSDRCTINAVENYSSKRVDTARNSNFKHLSAAHGSSSDTGYQESNHEQGQQKLGDEPRTPVDFITPIYLDQEISEALQAMNNAWYACGYATGRYQTLMQLQQQGEFRTATSSNNTVRGRPTRGEDTS